VTVIVLTDLSCQGRSKKHSHAARDDDGASESDAEDTGEPPASTTQATGKLGLKYHCDAHGHACVVLASGEHKKLINADIALWALAIVCICPSISISRRANLDAGQEDEGCQL
jgi:hypothetical protein